MLMMGFLLLLLLTPNVLVGLHGGRIEDDGVARGYSWGSM